jgi:hypothetical protein
LETSVALPPPAQPSGALWEMFFSPIATLQKLRERPRVALPVLVAAVWATIVSFYVIQTVGLRTLVEASIRATATVDPDALIAAAMQSKTQILIMQGAGAFFGTLLSVFALALFYYLLVAVVGGDVTYKAVAAVVAHVTLFLTIVKQTMIATVATLNSSSFSFQQPLGTNLGFFIDADSQAMAKVLTSVDILSIAGLVLTIFGLRAVSDRFSGFAASAVVVLPWLVYVGARAFLPAII